MKAKFSLIAFAVMFVFAFAACDLNDKDKNGNNNPSGGEVNYIPGTYMVQVFWSQGSPYNDLFPYLPDHPRAAANGRLPTDCATTATVQIMAFHKHPARGIGQGDMLGPHKVAVPTLSFEVDYPWDKILERYTNANPGTGEQRDAVATLMYHYGVAIGTGGVMTALTANFGYDKTIQSHQRKYFTDEQWEAMIRQQLDAGLPVWYHGSSIADDDDDEDDSKDSNHAFVVDGYDNAGKFHINTGWSGSQYDGWYSLNDINLGNGRHYNYNNVIRINIKPDKGGTGSNEMALMAFTAGATSSAQNELSFTVSTQIRSAGYYPGGQLGVALTDNNGSIIEVIGTRSFNSLNPTGYRTTTTNCFVPESVNPGQYQLRIVTRPEGGEWKTITVSAFRDRVPSAIPFTVTAGEANGGGYGLVLEEFTTSKNTVSPGEQFDVRVRTRNRGLDVFPGGQIGVALVDDHGKIEVIRTRDWASLNVGSFRSINLTNCYVPYGTSPGQYQLRIVVRPEGGEWRIATMYIDGVPTSYDFTVTADEANGGGYGLALTSFSSSETTVRQNELFTVSSVLRNVALDPFPGGQIGAALVDNAGNIVAVIGAATNSNTLNSGSTRTVTIYSFVPQTVQPESYRLRVVVKPTGSNDWKFAAIYSPDILNAIPFTVTAGEAKGGGYGLVLEQFEPEKTSVPQNETFTVTVKPRNRSGEAFSGQIGVVLVDDNGKIEAIIGTGNISLSAGNQLTSNRTCTIPNTVGAGEYRLMIVVRPGNNSDNNEWRIATLAMPDIPTSIDFTVQ